MMSQSHFTWCTKRCRACSGVQLNIVLGQHIDIPIYCQSMYSDMC